MTIHKDISLVLPRLQEEAESLMVHTGIITRIGEVTTDSNGFEHTSSSPIYEGICKVRSFRPYEQERDVAGATVTTQRYDLHIPAMERMPQLLGTSVQVWSGPVQLGDYVTVTMHGITRHFRIGAPHLLSWQTAQRMLVDEVLGGIPS